MDDAHAEPTPFEQADASSPAPPVPADPFASEPSAATLEPPPPVTERLSFTGDGKEYFKIWIVNVALTIATLGIYSAWAKVRRLQYFHRNTRLAGASFDYTGDPIAIFKGRLIAGGLFALYTFAGILSPIFAGVVLVGIWLAMPWMLNRSLRFRLRNTTYRGLAFRFSGTTKQAYWVFLALPILTVLSLFTIGPLWHQRIKRYQFNHASFGQKPFAAEPPVGDFYVTYIAAALIGTGVFGVIAAILTAAIGGAFVLSGGTDGDMSEETASLALGFAFIVIAPIYVAGILTLQAFTTARVRNSVWNTVTLGPRQFTSSLRTPRLLWLTLTNLLGTIATLGLFWPFAQVRLAKYYTETLSVTGPATFADLEAAPGEEENAIGEEVSDAFDFDISF